jgi:hypothetical protein
MKAFVEEMTQAQEDVEEGNVETLLDQQPRRKSKAAEAEAIKTYETETQKITAVVEDDDEDYSDMPPLAPAPPPKGSQKKTIGSVFFAFVVRFFLLTQSHFRSRSF